KRRSQSVRHADATRYLALRCSLPFCQSTGISMLKKGITIKARIGLTMAFLAALLVAIGGFGLVGMSRSNNAYEDTFTNQMPSAVNIGNAELFAARERLALDRAAFMVGTPESAPTLERARTMRATSDAWWKKYMDLPRDATEDRL